MDLNKVRSKIQKKKKTKKQKKTRKLYINHMTMEAGAKKQTNK